jgi:hypothetical protein
MQVHGSGGNVGCTLSLLGFIVLLLCALLVGRLIPESTSLGIILWLIVAAYCLRQLLRLLRR